MTRDRIVTADASQVSARSFFDAVTGRTDEQRAEERRQMDERCINAILYGSTYGWPPATVERCRKIIAEREEEDARARAFGLPTVGEITSDHPVKRRRAA